MNKAVVSIARIKNDSIAVAVEEAIDLLGGIASVTEGKERIMLKPNMVLDDPECTTNPEVIRALAQLVKEAGKEILIGEGSGGAREVMTQDGMSCRTKNPEILDEMQQIVFDKLGYTDLARSLDVPLINLNTGEMMDVEVPGGFAFDRITLHRSLTEIDLLCSVPMMKTHVMATVTLGMKNLIGLYPGVVYSCPKRFAHDRCAEVDPSGINAAIIDMVRVNKLGLVVIDASMGMEGNGPIGGTPVKMDLIIAGTNPLATDIVAASVMGFEPDEIPQFDWAEKAGMSPTRLGEIEVRGERIDNVRRNFVRADVTPWAGISDSFAVHELT
ncbi:DUF362 domain-containing protein [Candidatus Poribacteria bacterium]